MSDAGARQVAIATDRSVVVQAPAGSGKTTLLVERYLGLLDTVEAPEEILAITFTRKAAAEMRERVLRYLDPAFESTAEHEQGALARARAVRDKVAAWGLHENPQRLLIRTIDSFNHYLARTMPVASALGPVPAPADDTRLLYRQAARTVLGYLDDVGNLADDLGLLLEWRDHRSQDIENLLAALLGRRDQWLRALSIAGPPDRAQFEAALRAVIELRIRTANRQLSAALDAIQGAREALPELLAFAARELELAGMKTALACFAEDPRLPGLSADDVPRWTGLATALLTQDNTFRRQVNKNQGFPPKVPEKARFQAILDALGAFPQLAEALASARSLPLPHYDDAEWTILEALIRVLRQASAELELLFASAGRTDFSGLGQAALRGLGSEESGYTDLGLYLDRRIRHILVDEFQDTNWAQLHLLEKLTAGWEPDDGRTLFVVGDPMQSIYRFREADVGLFLRARADGIGALPLEFVQLTRNFRARAEIVDWVNTRIGPIFPAFEDASAGAVGYAASEAGRESGGGIRLLALSDPVAEGDAIARHVAAALAAHAHEPNYKAAIIVRARSHLQFILPALASHGIRYRAVKLAALLERTVVQDLLTLTRLVLQPADLTALLAVLRAPIAGLTLADLHALAGDGRSAYAPDALQRLSADGQERARPVFEALADARSAWRRRPVRAIVEGLWQRLGGPESLDPDSADPRDANAYLEALSSAEDDGILDDWNDFMERLAGLMTEGDPPSPSVRLEILTMHGAKGLEWDLVVLPALERTAPQQRNELLHWLPFNSGSGVERVLLAPLRSAETPTDAELVRLIRGEQRSRERYEIQRLLYVATTRAREELVLSAVAGPDKDGTIRAPKGSLLAELCQTCEPEFRATLEITATGALGAEAETVDETPDSGAAGAGTGSTPEPMPFDQRLRRAAAGWRPEVRPGIDWTPRLPPREATVAVDFFWAGLDARRTGTVLHRLLEAVGRVGLEDLTDQTRSRLIARIPVLLRALGSRADTLPATSALVQDAFEATLADPAGRWVLSGRHRDAGCELTITGILDGELTTAVIDRTFVTEDGTRWIIDYKSGYHAGADLDAFFAQEGERYRTQLTRYRRLFAGLGADRIETALYLPRHGRLEVVPT